MKKYFSLLLASAIMATLLPLSALADEGRDEGDESTSQTEETKNNSDDSLGDTSGSDDSIDLESEIESENLVDDLVSEDESLSEDSSSEDSEGDDETVTEEVSDSDMSDEALAEVEKDWSSIEFPQTYLLSVQWGFFSEDRNTGTATTYDSAGTITFEGKLISKPVKIVKFEKGEDSIDFDNTDEHSLAFNSTIIGANDGIFFKVKADIDATGEDLATIIFNNEQTSSDQTVSLKDLVDAGGEEIIDLGVYDLKFKLWTRDDWIAEKSDRASIGDVATDADKAAWYAKYMNVAVGDGFFSGYKDKHGKSNGKIGPNDTLTRLQLLKVAYELSKKLNMGVGSSGCDPLTVTTDDTLIWLGDNWAKGYVQCIENSGTTITLLDTVINGDLAAANEPAFRWEVITTVFEMLQLNASSDASSDLSDLEELDTEVEDEVNTSVELGIITGYSDGTFKPEKTVNRAEMFKIISLFYEVYSM